MIVVAGVAAAVLGIALGVVMHVSGITVIPLAAWLFLATVAASTVFLLEVGFRLATPSADARGKLRLLVGTSLVLLFVVEGVFRHATLRWATYTERNGGVYLSAFAGRPTWFNTYRPGETFRDVKSEFTHVRTINALGLPDREFVVDKSPAEFRILGLGDSFTEGVGTSADTTWLRVMQRRLEARYPERRVTTLNAGVSGSDPFFEYVLLKEKLRPFHPDLVIVAINTSDVNDILLRGGEERFKSDGTVAYGTAPAWERLYGLSYIWRAIVHEGLGYDFLFVRDRDRSVRDQEASRRIGTALNSIRALCREDGMDLLILSIPSRGEIEIQQYLPAYGALMRHLAQDPSWHVLDLLAYYAQHGPVTKDNASKFYWTIDLHPNTDGYRVMGEAIAANVVQKGLGPAPQ